MGPSAPELPSAVLLVLRRAGIRIAGGDLESMLLVLPDRRSAWVAVQYKNRSLTATAVEKQNRSVPTDRRPMYAARAATPDVLAAARAGNLDLVIVDPATVIIAGTEWLTTDHERQRVTHRARGSQPWGRWAVERVLVLAAAPLTQAAIAEAAGTTQQAVSLVLRDHPHVVRDEIGWSGDDDLLDAWLSEYPGPGGAATDWYSLDDLATQARSVAELTSELTVNTLFSGDLAADVYAPWRRPVTTRVYTSEFVDFYPAGFTATDLDNATMTAVIPRDPTLWRTSRHDTPASAPGPLVDPLITLWDLRHSSSGADAEEAVTTLTNAIRTNAIRG